MKTYIYALKCMACGLHYNVYSWDEDWSEKHKSFCPECGTEGSSLQLRVTPTDQQIFEFVPGPPSQEYLDYLKSQGREE